MTASLFIPPGLVLIAGGLVLPLLSGRLRSGALIALPLLTLALIWTVPDGPALQVPFLGYELALVEGDKLSRLFATVFAIMAFGVACSRSTRRAPGSSPPPSSMPAAPSASLLPAISSPCSSIGS